MADKKRDILEFVEQSNFEQFTPTRNKDLVTDLWDWSISWIQCNAQTAQVLLIIIHYQLKDLFFERVDDFSHPNVTLHVVTDWQISDDFDPELCEMIGRTDARQHQQLRRRDRAGADHDLAVSLRNLFAAAVSELHPVSLRSWIMAET